MTFVIIRETVVPALPDLSGVSEGGREEGREEGYIGQKTDGT